MSLFSDLLDIMKELTTLPNSDASLSGQKLFGLSNIWVMKRLCGTGKIT